MNGESIMVYSESGGVTKTATAASLARTAAGEGMKTLLIDLDPRGATTKWLGVAPKESGLHVGAIIADEDPEGWAGELMVQSSWHKNLHVIPSDRALSLREADKADHAEIRLKRSLTGVDVDLVVIDCPNRQGGLLTLSALTVSDKVVYASTPTGDGYDGVLGARQSVQRFQQARQLMGAPANIVEAGIVLGGVQETVMSRMTKTTIDNLRATGLLLTPLIPHRTIVQEVRETQEWYGDYRKGQPVAAAYQAILKEILGTKE